jgi:hypothetical protein
MTDNELIAVCAHCGKAMTAKEIKLTVKGDLIAWDERQERSNITLDYCLDGKIAFEQIEKRSIRDARNREEELRQMDALDKLQKEMNKKNGAVPVGKPT